LCAPLEESAALEDVVIVEKDVAIVADVDKGEKTLFSFSPLCPSSFCAHSRKNTTCSNKKKRPPPQKKRFLAQEFFFLSLFADQGVFSIIFSLSLF
jgi:hypothetical protein